jgi:hypothetical protein
MMNTLDEYTPVSRADAEPGLLTRHGQLVELVPGGRWVRREPAAAHPAASQRASAGTLEPSPVSLELAGLEPGGGLAALLALTLQGGIELTGGDFGNIQLFDPVSGTLEIVAHSGFGTDFLAYFALVDGEDGTACGRAAHGGVQTVIDDVLTDPEFRPNREIAEASGFRAVQSTPLIDHDGKLVGVLSTHFERPGRMPEQDLRMMRVFGRLAGEAVVQALRTEALNRAAADAPAKPDGWPQQRRGVSDETLSPLAEDAVHRLFGASVNLAEAYGSTSDPSLRYQIANAVADIDLAIRQIRTAGATPAVRRIDG